MYKWFKYKYKLLLISLIPTKKIETNFSCDPTHHHFYLNKKTTEMKFLMDVMLGKLAFYFRNLGIDAFYVKEKDDERLLDVAKNDQRIIITRNKILFNTKHGLPCLMPHSTNIEGFQCKNNTYFFFYRKLQRNKRVFQNEFF